MDSSVPKVVVVFISSPDWGKGVMRILDSLSEFQRRHIKHTAKRSILVTESAIMVPPMITTALVFGFLAGFFAFWDVA